MKNITLLSVLTSQIIDVFQTKHHSMIPLEPVIHLTIPMKVFRKSIAVQGVEMVRLAKGINGKLPIHLVLKGGISLKNVFLEAPAIKLGRQVTELCL